MSFHVGQKVVCVDAAIPILAQILRAVFRMPWRLQKGETYTVARMAIDLGVLTVELVEVKNTRLLGYCFLAARFRPLVERKTDISVFTAMLDRQKQGEPA